MILHPLSVVSNKGLGSVTLEHPDFSGSRIGSVGGRDVEHSSDCLIRQLQSSEHIDNNQVSLQVGKESKLSRLLDLKACPHTGTHRTGAG